jgi:hypothetical protein
LLDTIEVEAAVGYWTVGGASIGANGFMGKFSFGLVLGIILGSLFSDFVNMGALGPGISGWIRNLLGM